MLEPNHPNLWLASPLGWEKDLDDISCEGQSYRGAVIGTHDQYTLCSVLIIVNTVIGGLTVDAVPVECTPKSVECRVCSVDSRL